MNFSDYQHLAMRTAADLGMVLNTQHACLGIISELGELCDMIKRHIAYGKPLDAVNAKEEIGDICWYVALLCKAFGHSIEELEFSEAGVNRSAAEVGTCSLTTVALGACYLGMLVVAEGAHDEDDLAGEGPNHADVGGLLLALAVLARRFGFTLQDAMEANIAKLQKRFPDKFDADLAISRDVAAERVILEAHGVGSVGA